MNERQCCIYSNYLLFQQQPKVAAPRVPRPTSMGNEPILSACLTTAILPLLTQVMYITLDQHLWAMSLFYQHVLLLPSFATNTGNVHYARPTSMGNEPILSACLTTAILPLLTQVLYITLDQHLWAMSLYYQHVLLLPSCRCLHR